MTGKPIANETSSSGMFARLKDFRRVTTRYDELARNYLAGILLAATTLSWA
jgi:transposase